MRGWKSQVQLSKLWMSTDKDRQYNLSDFISSKIKKYCETLNYIVCFTRLILFSHLLLMYWLIALDIKSVETWLQKISSI